MSNANASNGNEEDDVKARKSIVSPAGFGAAATGLMALVALTTLTGCAPKGTDATNDAAQHQVPALANAEAESSSSAAPAATTAPPAQLTESIKAVSIAKMGKVVTDQKGWVLYRFDADTAKPSKSNCENKCAKVWPPAITDGNPKLSGVDASLVGTVTRADGSMQITLNGWPLYRYIGDKTPGKWTGQNVGGKWFVSAPDGKKNLTCLPSPPPKAVEPPADNAGDTNTNSNSNANNNSGSGDSGTGSY